MNLSLSKVKKAIHSLSKKLYEHVFHELWHLINTNLSTTPQHHAKFNVNMLDIAGFAKYI